LSPYFAGLTSGVTLLIFPAKRVSAPMPIPRATGVWLSCDPLHALVAHTIVTIAHAPGALGFLRRNQPT
jgi:hypothetical protein